MPFRVRFVEASWPGCCSPRARFGVQSSFAASIVLTLNADNTLELRLDNGVRIRASSPPAVIAPGTYAAVVISEVPDSSDGYHMFHLSGPGVNLQTDLLAGDDRAEPHTISLQPNSVYTFRDERTPALGSIVFSTSGAGTAVSAGSNALERQRQLVRRRHDVEHARHRRTTTRSARRCCATRARWRAA